MMHSYNYQKDKSYETDQESYDNSVHKTMFGVIVLDTFKNLSMV